MPNDRIADICARLSITPTEAAALMASGDLVVSDVKRDDLSETMPHRGNLLNGGFTYISDRADWMLFRGFKQFQILAGMREAGESFATVLASLDRGMIATEIKKSVIALAGRRKAGEIDICRLPLLGEQTDVIMELAAANYRMVLSWCIQPLITRDVDAVVDIGGGVGDLIVSLALNNQGASTKFFATDISRYAVASALHLAAIAGVKNVIGSRFDLAHPSFEFLSGYKNILVIASGVFSYFSGVEQFMEALIARGSFRLCLFETISGQMGVANALVKEHAVVAGTDNVGVWHALKPFIDTGRLKVEKIIPDLIGKSPTYPLTMVQIAPGDARYKKELDRADEYKEMKEQKS